MTNRQTYTTRIENEFGSRKLIWIGTRGHDAWYRLPHTGVNAPLHDHNPNFVLDTSPHVLEVAESGYVVHSCGAAYQARALEAVGELVRRGCDPVLSPFLPDPHTPFRNAPPPTVDFLEESYDRAMEIVERHGRNLGPRCIPCTHNTLTFPDESGQYFLTQKPSLSALRMEAS